MRSKYAGMSTDEIVEKLKTEGYPVHFEEALRAHAQSIRLSVRITDVIRDEMTDDKGQFETIPALSGVAQVMAGIIETADGLSDETVGALLATIVNAVGRSRPDLRHVVQRELFPTKFN